MGPLFTPEQLAEAQAYNYPRYVSAALAPLLDVAVFAGACLGAQGLLRWARAVTEGSPTGMLQRLRQRQGLAPLFRALDLAWGDATWAAAMLFALSILSCLWLVKLPEKVYFDLVWERRFGLSAYTTQGFLLDLLKGFVTDTLAFAAFAFGMFGLVRRTRAWWLVLGGVCGALLLVAGALDPYRSQLYFTNMPLPPGPLREHVTALLQEAHVDVSNVVVQNDSRATKKINAQFLGQGPTRTLVLSDSLLKNLSEDEVLAAVSHEAGHVHEPRWVGRVGAALALMAFLFLSERLFRAAARRHLFGIERVGDVRTLPLMLLLFATLTAAMSPISAAVERHYESAADAYGLALTKNPGAFERLWIKAAKLNKMDPYPPLWAELLCYGHPPLSERLQAVYAWRASHPGATPWAPR